MDKVFINKVTKQQIWAWGLFFWALFLMLASKGAALAEGFSRDDYVLSVPASTAAAWDISKHFLEQGRYSMVPLSMLFAETGINYVSVQFFATLLCFVAFSAFVASVFRPALQRGAALPAVLVGAALVAVHPYLSEYYTFRQAALPSAIAWALMAGVMLILFPVGTTTNQRLPKNWRRALLASLLTALAAGINQLVVPAVFCSLMALALFTSMDSRRQRRGEVMRAFYIPLFAAIIYVLLNLVLIRATGTQVEGRSTLLSPSAIPQRLTELWKLIGYVFYGNEPIFRRGTKVVLLASLTITYVVALIRNHRLALLTLACGLLMLMASIGAVFIGATWWPVPRSISVLAMALGLFAWALTDIARLRLTTVAWIWALPVFLMSANSAAVYLDQIRINHWDQNKAAFILHDVDSLTGPSDHRPILIGNVRWGYPAGPEIGYGDINISAFTVQWAAAGLFREAAGAARDIRIGPEITMMCENRAHWPSPESINVREKDILVCL